MKNKFTLVLFYVVSTVLLVLFNIICNDYGIVNGHRFLLLMCIIISYELGKPVYAAIVSHFNEKEVPGNEKDVSTKEK